jgi:GNAT superfamily N-acetyltransferase
MTNEQLLAAAHRSYANAFRKLAKHRPEGAVREDGSIFAFVSGISTPQLNGCVVVEPIAPEPADAALGWLDESGLPYGLWVDEAVVDGLAAVAADHGLVKDAWTVPAMALCPIPPAPEPAAGVTVRAGIEPGVADYIPRAMESDPDVRLFTAYLDGRPVGSSGAIRTSEVASVVAVGVIPEARRRGVGTAVSWAAVEAGRDWGCDAVLLEATEMGYAVYEAMGFQTITRYVAFAKS